MTSSYMAAPGIINPVAIPQIINSAVIETAVCDHFEISPEKIKRKSRVRRILLPRQIAMFLMRRHTSVGVKTIGLRYSMHHATVIHSVKLISDLLITDPEVKLSVGAIEKRLTVLASCNATK